MCIRDRTYTYSPSKPYSDGTTTWSSTLADVAMKYWVTDLRTDIAAMGTTASPEMCIRDSNGSVQVTSTVAKLVFKPSGQIDTQQTLTVCMPTTQPNINQRVLTVMVSGVVVSKNNDGGGACPA